MYEKLFEPIKIGSMELKNRLIVPAMSTLTATPEGASTEQFIAYHERKVKRLEDLLWYGIGRNI